MCAAAAHSIAFDQPPRSICGQKAKRESCRRNPPDMIRPRMIPKKPAPDLIWGGNRFSDQIMRKQRQT
jgi:hypothetical protein